jgi:phage terminase small subunit
MPALSNDRHEVFAQARARGMTQAAAYEHAGFRESRGAGSRLANDPVIAARITELAAELKEIGDCRLEATIIALLALARRSDLQETAAGAREARLARLEAWRLGDLLAARFPATADRPPPPPMTEAEWDAKYGPDAPGAA